jgi:hypothetical protein
MNLFSPLRFAHGPILMLGLFLGTQALAQTDPLPSWNDGAAKSAIVAFVKVITDKASPKFVPPEARIAAFDQDGTTWVEQPNYAEVMFAYDHLGAFIEKHPELKYIEPFKTVLSRDQAAIAKLQNLEEEKIVAAITKPTLTKTDKMLVRRRHDRQTGGHPSSHRASACGGLWQLYRRSTDA